MSPTLKRYSASNFGAISERDASQWNLYHRRPRLWLAPLKFAIRR
jgi:hypothetical protein